MKKWTVRVDDETAAVVDRFCRDHGLTIASILTAMVEALTNRYTEHGQQPVIEWDDGDRFVQLVEAARHIDADRRRRS